MKIKDYLYEQGKKMSKFADQVGISYCSMHHYTKGMTSPNLLTAVKIVVTSLGKVTLLDLLTESDLDELYGVINKLKENPMTKYASFFDEEFLSSFEKMIETRKGIDDDKTKTRKI